MLHRLAYYYYTIRYAESWNRIEKIIFHLFKFSVSNDNICIKQIRLIMRKLYSSLLLQLNNYIFISVKITANTNTDNDLKLIGVI